MGGGLVASRVLGSCSLRWTSLFSTVVNIFVGQRRGHCLHQGALSHYLRYVHAGLGRMVRSPTDDKNNFHFCHGCRSIGVPGKLCQGVNGWLRRDVAEKNAGGINLQNLA